MRRPLEATGRHLLSRVSAVSLPLAILALAALSAAEGSGPPLAGHSLADALAWLETQGLAVVYSSALVSPDMIVRIEPRPGDPRQVLEQLLEPFGLAVREAPGGVLVVVAVAGAAPTTGSISVVVVAPDRRELPEGVTLRVDGMAVHTTVASDGSFSISGVPPGERTVEALAPGFLPQSVGAVRVRAGAVTHLRFELKPVSVFLNEVVVTPSHYRILDDRPESRQVITREELARMPHVADDLLHAVKRLPGAAGADVSAQINLRGGVVDETLVQLDGLELYEPFHLKDFQSMFSTIDAEAVGKVDLLTGGFPVEYGDRMSGVLDISTVSSSSPTTASIGLGTLNARLLGQGTFDSDRGVWLASGRGWYPALLVDASGAVEEEIDAEYYDLLAKVEHAVGNRSTLSVNGLVAYDDLGFQAEDEESSEEVRARYQSYHLWLNLRTEWTPRLYSQTILSGGEVRRRRMGNRLDVEEGPLTVDDHRTLNFGGLKQDWTLSLDDRHLFKGGVDLRSQQAEYEYRRTWEAPGPGGTPVDESAVVDYAPSGVSLGCYVADRFRLSEALVAEVGLRWDAQRWLDEAQLSPRVNLYWSPSVSTTVRGSWGRFAQSQRLNEVEVEDGVSELASAQRAEHIVLSVEHRTASGLAVRLEGYDKQLDHLRSRHENLFNPIDLFPEAGSDRIEVSPDGGRAQGLELLVKQDQSRHLTWWFSYVLARAEDDVDGDMVPRSWDQRHAATLALNLGLPRRWNVNLGVTYHSGWPTTAVTGEVRGVDENGEPVVELEIGPRNRERLPEYYRLDLRATKRWEPSRFGQLSLVLEVVNLTNRRNVCGYDELEGVVTEEGEVEVQSTVLYWAPIVPSVSLMWQF